MPRNTDIRRHLLAREGAQKVKITKHGECHVYGKIPNTHEIGWFYAGAVFEVRRQIRQEAAARIDAACEADPARGLMEARVFFDEQPDQIARDCLNRARALCGLPPLSV